MLELMNRKHSKESYLKLIENIRNKIPGVSLSSDFICGFCSETEEDFEETLDLIRTVQYDFGFLFAYSMREKTFAHRKLVDDVPEKEKNKRLIKMIEVFREGQFKQMQKRIGSKEIVLIFGKGKFENQWKGSTGKMSNKMD